MSVFVSASSAQKMKWWSACCLKTHFRDFQKTHSLVLKRPKKKKKKHNLQHVTGNKHMEQGFKHAFTLHWQRNVFYILPYSLRRWGSQGPCDLLPWSNRWWDSTRLERKQQRRTRENVFTSLTKLDQRLAWESKKWCLFKYVCSNKAFHLS